MQKVKICGGALDKDGVTRATPMLTFTHVLYQLVSRYSVAKMRPQTVQLMSLTVNSAWSRVILLSFFPK